MNQQAHTLPDVSDDAFLGHDNWRTLAACQGLPLRSVFSVRPVEAAEVLRACNHCPVRNECEAVVDPANTWFDGVSGGRLWRNGREVKIRHLTLLDLL